MRGQRLFNDLIKGKSLETPAKKGRSDKLIIRRNECLLARYYYYGYYKNLCYEDIIRRLAAEFFLSPNTLIQIIQNNTDQLQLIKKRANALYYFQNLWPHLKW